MRVNVKTLLRNLVRSVVVMLMATIMSWPMTLPADQAQYSMTELGRLVAVVDGQGISGCLVREKEVMRRRIITGVPPAHA